MFWLKIPGFVDKKMVAECPDSLKMLKHHFVVVLNSGPALTNVGNQDSRTAKYSLRQDQRVK